MTSLAHPRIARRRGRAAAARLCAILALTLPRPALVGAQKPGAESDSVQVSFAVPRPRSAVGGAVGTLDSAGARGGVFVAPVPTLSDLLTARLAGVSAFRTSGTSGAAARLRIRGRNSLYGGGEPMLVVDGVVGALEQPANNTLFAGPATSRLDDIAPEDIERVDVLRGPAAAALFGVNANAGVIVVTTRRPSAGRLRLRGFSEAGVLDQGAEFGASYWRYGRNPSTGASGICALIQVAAGACLPDSLVRRTTFAGRDPFRVAPRLAAGASGEWGIPSAAVRGSTRYESEQGPLEPNALRRVSGRASAQLRPLRTVGLSLTTALVRGSVDLPAEGDILRHYLLKPPGGVQTLFFEQAPPFYDVPEGEKATRLTWGARAGWQPREWLRAYVAYGRDESSREGLRTFVYNGAMGTAPPFYLSYRRRRDAEADYATAALGAEATFRPSPSLEATTLVGGHRVRRRLVQESLDSLASADLGGSWSLTRGWDRSVAVGAYAQQRVAWGDRLSLGVGLLRAGTGRDGTLYDAHGYFTSADAAWTVRRAEPRPGEGGRFLGAMRLRAATGESPGALSPAVVRTALPNLPPGSGFQPSSPRRLRFERTRETEVGLDATLLAGRGRLELTAYRADARNLLLAAAEGAQYFLDNVGRTHTTGVEARLATSLLERARWRWDATLTAAANRQRMEGPSNQSVLFGPLPSAQQRFEPGRSPAGIWASPYSYADANGDRILGLTEVTVSGQFGSYVYRGPVDPTREIALQSSVRFLRRVELSALVDYRGGMWKVNATTVQRCRAYTCRQAQDPATPPQDQARAVVAILGAQAPGFVEKADFTKLREVALSADAPGRWATSVGVSSLRLTLAVRNIATWSGYGGADPEVGGGAVFSGAVDDFAQPLPRYVTARLSAAW